MDFFDALATIQKAYPSLEQSEIRNALDSEVKSEEDRLTGQRVRRKYARAVESSVDRILAWLQEGPQYSVDPSNLDSLCRFVGSHRSACVWAVLRSKYLFASHSSACDCQNCAVCKGIKMICGECHMCTRCHDHIPGCGGCKAIV